MIKYIFHRIYFFFFLWVQSFFRSLLRLFFSSVGIFFSVIMLLLIFYFSAGIQRAYQKNFLGSLPIAEIMVMPKIKKKSPTLAIPMLGMSMIKPQGLVYADYKKISQLNGVQIKGVIMPVFVPIRLEAHFMGKGLQSDIVLQGVSRPLIAKSLSKKYHAFQKKDQEIPVLLPQYMVTAYNSFAEINGLPSFNAKSLAGLRLGLQIGKSSFLSHSGNIIKMESIVAGISHLPKLYGLAIPLSEARKINRTVPYIDRDYYSALFVVVANPGQVYEINQKLKKMGYLTESGADISEKAKEAVTGVETLLYIFAAIILFFSALTMSYGFAVIVQSKQKELFLFRVLGASRFWILLFLLSQVGVFAYFFAKLGQWAAHFFMRSANDFLSDKINIMGIKAGELFYPPSDVIGQYLQNIPFIAVLFALIIILFPALQALNRA